MMIMTMMIPLRITYLLTRNNDVDDNDTAAMIMTTMTVKIKDIKAPFELVC